MHRVAVTCVRTSRASNRAASGLASIDITSTNSKPSYDSSITASYSLTRFLPPENYYLLITNYYLLITSAVTMLHFQAAI